MSSGRPEWARNWRRYSISWLAPAEVSVRAAGRGGPAQFLEADHGLLRQVRKVVSLHPIEIRAFNIRRMIINDMPACDGGGDFLAIRQGRIPGRNRSFVRRQVGRQGTGCSSPDQVIELVIVHPDVIQVVRIIQIGAADQMSAGPGRTMIARPSGRAS
jgi:hypothetical protein